MKNNKVPPESFYHNAYSIANHLTLDKKLTEYYRLSGTKEAARLD